MRLHLTFSITFRRVKLGLAALLFSVCVPRVGLSELNVAPDFTLSAKAIVQGGCYTLRIANWPGALLNLGYTTAWTGQQYVYGFPSLDYGGRALLCSTLGTHAGMYTYNYVSNTTYYQWWVINASVTISATPPSAQPTSLTFHPSSGYAGLDCYTMNVSNGSNMTVDFSYAINTESQPVWSATMDGTGQWRYCLNHYNRVGDYIFYRIKKHSLSDWVILDPPAIYSVKPPQPLWLITTPDGLVQGNWYQMSVANGADITLDVKYTLNDGPVQTIIGWPTLISADPSTSSSSGYVNIWTGASTAPGKYAFSAIRNTLNTDWVPVAAVVAVCPNVSPMVSSIVPSTVPQGGSTQLTINGTNLCSVSVQSATPNGLSFSNVRWDVPFVSATVTATAAATTPIGPAQIRLTTPAGSITSTITVGAPPALQKEYIYLGERVISTVSP